MITPGDSVSKVVAVSSACSYDTGYDKPRVPRVVRCTDRSSHSRTVELARSLAERSPLLLRTRPNTSQSRGENASTLDRVCRRYIRHRDTVLGNREIT